MTFDLNPGIWFGGEKKKRWFIRQVLWQPAHTLTNNVNKFIIKVFEDKYIYA